MNVPLLLAVTVGLSAIALPCGGRQPNLQDARSAAKIGKKGADLAERQRKLSAECDKIRFSAVAWDEEQVIGQTVAMRLIGAHRLLPARDASEAENAAAAYLNRVGGVVAARSDRPNLPWAFAIIDSDDFNAFATPGGFVFVTRGLLQKVENEAQLAGVLAHEIAHVTHRHALNAYRVGKYELCQREVQKMGAAGAAGIASDELVRRLVGSQGSFINLNSKGSSDHLKALTRSTELAYEKEDKAWEKQADEEAVKLVLAAGYQPGEFIRFLDKLPKGANLKHHPSNAERKASLDHQLKVLSNPPDLRSALAPFGKKEGFAAPPLGAELQAVRPR